MDSFIETNDTLRINKEQGFPADLLIEEAENWKVGMEMNRREKAVAFTRFWIASASL